MNWKKIFGIFAAFIIIGSVAGGYVSAAKSYDYSYTIDGVTYYQHGNFGKWNSHQSTAGFICGYGVEVYDSEGNFVGTADIIRHSKNTQANSAQAKNWNYAQVEQPEPEVVNETNTTEENEYQYEDIEINATEEVNETEIVNETTEEQVTNVTEDVNETEEVNETTEEPTIIEEVEEEIEEVIEEIFEETEEEPEVVENITEEVNETEVVENTTVDETVEDNNTTEPVNTTEEVADNNGIAMEQTGATISLIIVAIIIIAVVAVATRRD